MQARAPALSARSRYFSGATKAICAAAADIEDCALDPAIGPCVRFCQNENPIAFVTTEFCFKV
jgi:hypothetical protein